MVLLVNMHLITNINNSLSWTKQAVEVEKKANKILGVRSKGTYSLVALLSRNGPICPWAALYASTTPSPGVHRTKGQSVLNPFSVVRRALFVTITVVPVTLIQCYRTWVGKILRHVGRSPTWQCFFKIKTGNVRISFPNDPREVHCPYLTGSSAQHPFQFQRYSSTINDH